MKTHAWRLLIAAALPLARSDQRPLLALTSEGLACPESASPAEDFDCVLGKLYPPGHAHSDTAEDGSEDRFAGDTYGESTPAGMRLLSPHVSENFGGAGLREDEDVFLDAGSGFGKAALQLFTEASVRDSYGVELHHGRCAVARDAAGALAHALGAPLAPLPKLEGGGDVDSVQVEADGRRLGLLCGDVLSLPEWGGGFRMEDVTVVMANSLCFPLGVMASFQLMLQLHLSPGALVYSSQALRGCHRGFLYVGRLHQKDTWSIPGLFHTYIVAPRPAPFVFTFAAGGHPTSEPVSDVTRSRWSSAPRSLDAKSAGAAGAFWAQGRSDSPTECVLADLAWWLQARPGPNVWSELQAEDPAARRFQGGAEFVSSSRLNVFAAPQDAAHSLYQQALEYRSPSLLRALHAGGEGLNLTADRATGRTLCHHELTAGARGRGEGLLMLGMLPQLDGEDQMFAPPGALFDLLREELGVSCAASDLAGRLPLHLAAQAGHAPLVAQLLEISGSRALQAKDQYGSSPLHLAAGEDAARALLDARADVEATDQDGLSPLLAVAARASSWSSTPLTGPDLLDEEAGCPMSSGLVELLAERRAEIGATSTDGWTALHHAAGAEPKLFSRPETIASLLVEPLLKLRLDVNAQDSAGRAPLHLATHAAVARQLLEGRADVNAVDKKGRTALKSAKRRRPGYSSLKRVLEEFGAGSSKEL